MLWWLESNRNSAVCCPSCQRRVECNLILRAPRSDDGGVLSAGRGRPVRTLTGCFVPALAVVVPASRCGVRCLSFVKPRGACRIGGTGDMPVQALFPQGGGCLQLASSSGWSRVVGIDAVGGPPHCDFADKCGARVTSCCTPRWRANTSPGVVLDLLGEVGDELGSLCQVVAPDGMGMQR